MPLGSLIVTDNRRPSFIPTSPKKLGVFSSIVNVVPRMSQSSHTDENSLMDDIGWHRTTEICIRE